MPACTHNNHRWTCVKTRTIIWVARIISIIRIPSTPVIIWPRAKPRGKQGGRFQKIIRDFLANLGLIQAGKRLLIQRINRAGRV